GGGARAGQQSRSRCCAAVLRVLVLQAAWALSGGQVRYSVPEEAKVGTVVGRLAQDLGLEAEARRLRLVAQGRRASVEVSGASGALLVSSRLDREELCGKSAPCALRLEVLLERPLRVFHVHIAELTTLPGSRFPLEGASDADIGANAQLTYTLSPSENFGLEVKSKDENKISVLLVLTKPLDRETVPVHRLVLTASDGVQLSENTAPGTVFFQITATDKDDGINQEIYYSFSNAVSSKIQDLFKIDEKSGEIQTAGVLDFEDTQSYDLEIEARDKGTPPLSGHCSVELKVLDVNDNAPEVWVTSLSVPVPEDASVGTVVALLSVSDRDSGENGRVRCWVWPASPFGLEATFAGSYSLVLREALDRERVSEYEVEVDGGRPSLTGTMKLVISVVDANDNTPQFNQSVYKVKLPENTASGTVFLQVTATDKDAGINQEVYYYFSDTNSAKNHDIFKIDEKSGELRTTRELDFEDIQSYDLEIKARDRGIPPLSGHCRVELEVLDVNDNAPEVRAPWRHRSRGGSESGTLWAWAAWGAPAGQVVAKIRAVDADSGYNAWLRYELWEPRGKGPFRVGLYSGEVSTARALDEADGPRQRLLIVVRDHGEPARSATATLSVSLLEAAEAALLGPGAASAATNVWLVVAICAVSSLFLLAVVLYGASRWAPRAAVLSGPGPTTLVCASEVGSWSYSQRHSRSLCVADGAAKSDLMVFSPNFPPPPPGPAPKDTQPEPSALLDTVSDTAFVPFCVPFHPPY
uniref:Cadherin domain-containing protein n=1 Tax=Serinus canaria TaxID=9135 RepID=A0A8C9N2T4_SERCA